MAATCNACGAAAGLRCEMCWTPYCCNACFQEARASHVDACPDIPCDAEDVGESVFIRREATATSIKCYSAAGLCARVGSHLVAVMVETPKVKSRKKGPKLTILAMLKPSSPSDEKARIATLVIGEHESAVPIGLCVSGDTIVVTTVGRGGDVTIHITEWHEGMIIRECRFAHQQCTTIVSGYTMKAGDTVNVCLSWSAITVLASNEKGSTIFIYDYKSGFFPSLTLRGTITRQNRASPAVAAHGFVIAIAFPITEEFKVPRIEFIKLLKSRSIGKTLGWVVNSELVNVTQLFLDGNIVVAACNGGKKVIVMKQIRGRKEWSYAVDPNSILTNVPAAHLTLTWPILAAHDKNAYVIHDLRKKDSPVKINYSVPEDWIGRTEPGKVLPLPVSGRANLPQPTPYSQQSFPHVVVHPPPSRTITTEAHEPRANPVAYLNQNGALYLDFYIFAVSGGGFVIVK